MKQTPGVAIGSLAGTRRYFSLFRYWLPPCSHAGDVGVGQVRPEIDHVVFLSAIRCWFIVRLLSSPSRPTILKGGLGSGISLSERNQADGLIRIGG